MERAAKYWRTLYHLQSVTNVKIEFGKSGVGEKYADLEVERRGRPPANKMTTGRYRANTKHIQIQSKYKVCLITTIKTIHCDVEGDVENEDYWGSNIQRTGPEF